MKRKISIYAILALFISTFAVSCNDDSDDDGDSVIAEPSYSSVMVSSFSLQPDDSILANLDSVYFSIDLDRAVVFNADSLPKGTKVNRLVIKMGLSAVSKAEITMPNDRGADTVVNYLTNSSDSINFSRGSVKLHLESGDGEVKRDYTIYVNVHTVDPDLMVWTEAATATLPTNLISPQSQRTVEYDGKILCFTRQGSDYCVAETDDPSSASWTKTSADLPDDAILSSLTATSNALYVIARGEELYKSTDGGTTWTSTGVSMCYIYGAVSDRIVGLKHGVTGLRHVTYPASIDVAVDASCPVSGTSPAFVYSTEWSDNPMLIVAGGKTALGEYVGGCWAFDGTQWAQISLSEMPGLEAPMIIPYFAFKTNNFWRVTKQSVLLAVGGILESGDANRTVYISYDCGVHWSKASDQMQLSGGYVPGAYGSAIVYNKTMTSRSSASWRDYPLNSLPRWYAVENSGESRAVKPITEWDCPYIYLFGGESPDGTLYNQVWRGVINRLQFKPLQ